MATLIYNVTALQNISLDLAGDYELANDIDASGFGFATLGDSTHPFTGQIDGKGYKISTLTISNIGAGSRKAAFIYKNTGTVKNLHFEDCSITAQSTNSNAYGSIIAYDNGGTIIDCPVEGSITVIGNSTTGLWCEAGSISAFNYGIIRRCNSDITISVTNTEVASGGGITDWNETGGEVDQCFSAGSITIVAGGIYTAYASGLVSDNDGIIKDSYSLATCNASGGTFNYGAGFVDENANIVENSYSIGSVVAGSTAGFCRTNSGTITACFWDTQASGQPTSPGGGTGKTTAQMKAIATFSVWDILLSATSLNNGYPFLGWQADNGIAWLIYGALSPRDEVEVEDKITLQSIREIEMTGNGRFYIDEEGNATYRSRLTRS